jgi:hypothetical protein
LTVLQVVILAACLVQTGTTIAFFLAFRGMRRALEDLGRTMKAAPNELEAVALEGAAVHPRDSVEQFSRALAVARASDGVLPSSSRR